MLILYFQCAACGFENDIAAPPESHAMTRDEILRRCKCRRCGHVGASDMRRYWNAGANALDGARDGE
ncbi:hypothetical protein [Marinovum algicola]|uniref:hypothetical protein n=1 Tax=Marinovum algicola TaxID=42444 RepID=UPI0024BA15BC|nr:hypothetical protein [Marinovum algicola]